MYGKRVKNIYYRKHFKCSYLSCGQMEMNRTSKCRHLRTWHQTTPREMKYKTKNFYKSKGSIEQLLKIMDFPSDKISPEYPIGSARRTIVIPNPYTPSSYSSSQTCIQFWRTIAINFQFTQANFSCSLEVLES